MSFFYEFSFELTTGLNSESFEVLVEAKIILILSRETVLCVDRLRVKFAYVNEGKCARMVTQEKATPSSKHLNWQN